MDNFNVLSKLGKGAQGTVQLVENKVSKELSVVKKVECSDRTEAMKAFDEAVALRKLKHPYVCGYKDFFVVWEPKEAAIYMCIVMEYYRLGDLEQALRHRHAHGDMLGLLGQEQLMRWLGQMLDALVYTHGMKLIHRDLKPSNIFLKDDLSVVIGDFGVATVMMSGTKHITRTTVGSVNWMAPEVLMEAKPHYDERSDVWSLGCIILAMALCGIKDHTATGALLFDLKTNLQVLESVVLQVRQHYGQDLCHALRTILCRHYEQRPSALHLSQLPYMQQCLQLAGSTLYKQPLDVGVTEVQAVPSTGGMQPVIEYMCKNKESEVCQELALKQLLSLRDISVDDEGKKQVLEAMTTFKSSPKIQTLCCRVFAGICTTVELLDGDILFSEEFIRPVCLALRSKEDCRDLYASVCTLLMALSSDESASDVIGRFGGIQVILSAMRHFFSDLDIVSDCCTTLWSLSLIEDNLKILTAEGCVQDICNVLEAHGDSKDCVDAALSALSALSTESDNLVIMSECDLIHLSLQILDKHMKNQDTGIVKLVLSLFSSLVQFHEICALHLLQTESGCDGTSILMELLHIFQFDAEVVKSVVSLWELMAQYEDVRLELLSLKVDSKLAKLGLILCDLVADDVVAIKQKEGDEEMDGAVKTIKRALQVLTSDTQPFDATTDVPSSTLEGMIA